MKKWLTVLLLLAMALTTFSRPSSAEYFKDIKETTTSKEELSYLIKQGIINSDPSANFRVNDAITRLEAAEMIARALQLKLDGRPAPNLIDISPSHPKYALISAVADEGIMTGNEKQAFNPDSTLTRGQMAAILVRAFKLNGGSGSFQFRDVPKQFWAAPAIQTLQQTGVTTGYPDNTFKPNQSLTRGHFVVFLARALEPSFNTTPACYRPNNQPIQQVNVAVATLWKQPNLTRTIDRSSVLKTVDLKKWTSSMTIPQKQWLVGKIESQALYGQEVKVLQTKGEWVQVAIPEQASPKHQGGYPGWMPKAQLTTVYPNYSTCEIARVKTKTAMLRNDDQAAKPFMEISFNTTLPVIGQEGDWILVQTPANGVKRLSKKEAAVFAAEKDIPKPTAKTIVATAKMFEGLPYLWAGTSGFGLDCSGFTYSVYRQHGIALPRDASVQAVNGKRVGKNELQLGDLLFFSHNKGKGAVHHVGMYIGNGKMIHSPNPKRSVEIVPIATEPYKSEFSGARRYLPEN